MAGATDQVSYLRHFVQLLRQSSETTAYVVGRYLHTERLSVGVCLLHRLLQRFDSGEPGHPGASKAPGTSSGKR
jgi:hypothetical protein